MLNACHAPYVEEAIRPHVAGRFADMLRGVATHPLMLHYLDQARSMGPNSLQGARRKDKGGLNENLAREMLELHTLGVDGPYAPGGRAPAGRAADRADLRPGIRVHRFRRPCRAGGGDGSGATAMAARTRGWRISWRRWTIWRGIRQTAQHIAQQAGGAFRRRRPDAGLVAHLGGAICARPAAIWRRSRRPCWSTRRPGRRRRATSSHRPISWRSALRALAITPDQLPMQNPGADLQHDADPDGADGPGLGTAAGPRRLAGRRMPTGSRRRVWRRGCNGR